MISRLFSLTKLTGTCDYLTKQLFSTNILYHVLEGFVYVLCSLVVFCLLILIAQFDHLKCNRHPYNSHIYTDTPSLTPLSSLLNFSDCILGEETFYLAFLHPFSLFRL